VVDAVEPETASNSGFLHAWTRGCAIEHALTCGNLAGAWSTTASGGTSAFREPQSLRALQAELVGSIRTTSPRR